MNFRASYLLAAALFCSCGNVSRTFVDANVTKATTDIRLTTTVSWKFEGREGPASWGQNFPLCNGEYQSPINIVEARAKRYPLDWQTSLTGFGLQTRHNHIRIQNEYSDLYMNFDRTNWRLTGGPLTSIYKFKEAHMHYGEKLAGSLHHFEGRRYSMEITFTLFPEDRKGPDLSLAVLYDEGNPHNLALTPIVTALDCIKFIGEEASVPGLNVRDLLPAKTNEFYYYKGSDFKPPCDERLVIVFKEIMEVSWFQMAIIRRGINTDASSFYHSGGDEIKNSFRGLQTIGDREVRLYYQASLAVRHSNSCGIVGWFVLVLYMAQA